MVFEEPTIDGKFIVVLTETADHIIHVIVHLIFLSRQRYVVVGSVHSGTHEVAGSGIDAYIVFVYVFPVYSSCYQMAVWAKHKTTELSVNLHIPHAGRKQNGFIYSSYGLSYFYYIGLVSVGPVGDTYAAREVYELYFSARLVSAHCQTHKLT